MLRLCSAEIYKLKKSKIFYICTAVTAGFVLLMYLMLSLASKIQSGDIENGTGGVVVTGDASFSSVWEEIRIMDMLPQLFSGNLIVCMLAVFVSIFVIGEYSSGMIKNIVGKGCPRAAVYISKLLMSVLGSAAITLTGVIAMFFFSFLFIGKHAFEGAPWRDICLYTGQQLFMMTALSAIYVLIAEITRNYAAGISAGIGICILPLLFVGGLDILFAGSGIVPSQLWIISRSIECPPAGPAASYLTQTAFVSVFWFAAAAALGLWHFYKTDIK